MPLLELPYVPFKRTISKPQESSSSSSTTSNTIDGLSDEARNKLLQFILADIGAVLKLNATEFSHCSATAADWLADYLAHQTHGATQAQPFFANNGFSSDEQRSGFTQRLETKLMRKAFQLLVRLSTLDTPVTLPLLIGGARVFATANLDVMGTLWAALINHKDGKSILADVDNAVAFFVQTVKSIQKRLEKGVDTGGGGGKGKGKSSSSGGGSSGGGESDSAAKEARDLEDIRLLADAALSFESIVLLSSTLSKSLSDSLVQSAEFINALVGCYGVANILSASKVNQVSSDDTPNASFEFLDAKTGFMAVVDPKFAFEFRHLKLSVIALLDTILTVSFFNPLKVEFKPETSIERTIQPPMLNTPTNIPSSTITEPLCDLLLSLLDSSPIEDPVKFLTATAPILVDLEVETGVSDRLKLVKEALARASDGHESDARLDFLIVSLEQMLAFSGNAMARKDKIEERRLRAAQEAEKQASSSKKKGGVKKAKESRKQTESAVVNDDYIHRTILISQVHDLFPELGEGFIEACLIALNNDSEQVIMKVLEDSLPDQVKKLERSLARSAPREPQKQQPSTSLKNKKSKTPAATESWPSLGPQDDSQVLSTRKNIYDNDEFDIFNKKKVDATKIIWGKKEKTGADLLRDTSDQKAAVLALHANALQEEEEYERMKREMDEQRMYDDEYDDTYDSTDIKLAGTVELHMLDETENSVDVSRVSRIHATAVFDDDDSEDRGSKTTKTTGRSSSSTNAIEQELFSIVGGPGESVLNKTSRKSVARQRLKAKLGWTDEMIEGWYVMFMRNPHHQRRMEEQFAWRGNRTPEAVASPKERAVAESEYDEEEDDDENTQGGGHQGPGGAARGGRGGSRGGRGGNRGGKANHSRRNQHAKKMARGMGGPV
ncbi:UNVERIFIED_CONTAM: hypothetical protein HDU68_010320 [Siphonaria sp. JEL0065]|nr:hypothetical protein HDU68_010320 [Siphonaria sp. JEL0065]